jgi:hypothetical protein
LNGCEIAVIGTGSESVMLGLGLQLELYRLALRIIDDTVDGFDACVCRKSFIDDLMLFASAGFHVQQVSDVVKAEVHVYALEPIALVFLLDEGKVT